MKRAGSGAARLGRAPEVVVGSPQIPTAGTDGWRGRIRTFDLLIQRTPDVFVDSRCPLLRDPPTGASRPLSSSLQGPAPRANESSRVTLAITSVPR